MIMFVFRDLSISYCEESIQSLERPCAEDVSKDTTDRGQDLPRPEFWRDDSARHEHDIKSSGDDGGGLANAGHKINHDGGEETLVLDLVRLFLIDRGGWRADRENGG